MTVSIFCPLCQRKNKGDATKCAYCGIKFVAHEPEAYTTQRISKVHSDIIEKDSRCAQYLPNLPEGGMALFVMNEDEPIIIEDASQIVLGRHAKNSAVPLVDFTEYEGAKLGVSRQHAQIISTSEGYTIIDLSSTNGTWLNQQRLTPGKPLPLQSNDYIQLGQLKLQACFHVKAYEIEEVIFYIKDLSQSSEEHYYLTPHLIASTISPYLQAIIEMHYICQECKGKTSKEVHVNAVSNVAGKPIIAVSLDGATSSVRLIRKWVIPWKEAHIETFKDDLTELSSELRGKLKQLAMKISADITPDPEASETDLEACSSRLMSPLTVLTTSNLVLSGELKTTQ